MYERNAIVLERYFYGIFNFKNSSNLRNNYYNYRKLFECYGILCDAKEKEEICQKEFDEAGKEVTRLQQTQEKLYNKSAKFEYSRYIIFCNTGEKTEDIEKHLSKVNEDVQNNYEELRQLGENFVKAVSDYNQKEANLKEATEAREKAQSEYDEAFENARTCYDEITEELLDSTKRFIKSDNKDNRKELQEIFDDNGKNEKNQFDPDVVSNTITKSIEIYKIEMDIYLAGHDRISKLFEEIESDSVKTDKHTKYYRDSKGKLDFLNAEKDYIVQFLDNERIGAIYDKKAHRKLMLEACKKFVLDFAQIEKLYDIIIKEVAGRWTKKIYKENYNKEYLLDLENASVEPSLDTGKMRQEAIAFVNLNYWRFEGMTSVYNAFEEVVTTIYERDLTEFLPVPEVVPPEDFVEEAEEIAAIEDFPFPEKTEIPVVQGVQEEPVEEVALEEQIEEEPVIELAEDLDQEELDNVQEFEQEEFDEDVLEDELEEEIEEIPESEEEIESEVEEVEAIEEPIQEIEEQPEEVEEEEIPIEQIRVDETPRSRVLYYSSKVALANAIYYSLQMREFAVEDEAEEVIEEQEENYEIPENVQEILAKVQEEEEKAAEEVTEIEDIIEEIEDEETSEETDSLLEAIEDIPDEEMIEEQAESLEEEQVEETAEEDDSEEMEEIPEAVAAIETLDDDETESIFQKIDTIEDEPEKEKENTFDLSKLDDLEGEDSEVKPSNIENDMEYEEDKIFDEAEEDSILEIYFSDGDNKEKESSMENIGKKVGLFKKLVGFNSKKKKEEA